MSLLCVCDTTVGPLCFHCCCQGINFNKKYKAISRRSWAKDKCQPTKWIQIREQIQWTLAGGTEVYNVSLELQFLLSTLENLTPNRLCSGRNNPTHKLPYFCQLCDKTCRLNQQSSCLLLPFTEYQRKWCAEKAQVFSWTESLSSLRQNFHRCS